jgi:hypothetical protein
MPGTDILKRTNNRVARDGTNPHRVHDRNSKFDVSTADSTVPLYPKASLLPEITFENVTEDCSRKPIGR